MIGRRSILLTLLASPLTAVKRLWAKPSPPLPSGTDILKSFDARDWAKAFVEHAKQLPGLATDEEAMTGWFANALMRGYDESASVMARLREEHDDMLALARGLPLLPGRHALMLQNRLAISALERIVIHGVDHSESHTDRYGNYHPSVRETAFELMVTDPEALLDAPAKAGVFMQSPNGSWSEKFEKQAREKLL